MVILFSWAIARHDPAMPVQLVPVSLRASVTALPLLLYGPCFSRLELCYFRHSAILPYYQCVRGACTF